MAGPGWLSSLDKKPPVTSIFQTSLLLTTQYILLHPFDSDQFNWLIKKINQEYNWRYRPVIILNTWYIWTKGMLSDRKTLHSHFWGGLILNFYVSLRHLNPTMLIRYVDNSNRTIISSVKREANHPLKT